MRCARCHGALSRGLERLDECAWLLFDQALTGGDVAFRPFVVGAPTEGDVAFRPLVVGAPTEDDAAFRPFVVGAPTEDDVAFRPFVVGAPTEGDVAFHPFVVGAPTEDDAALLERLVCVLGEPMFLRNRAIDEAVVGNVQVRIIDQDPLGSWGRAPQCYPY